MGWSSGTYLMEGIMKKLKRVVPDFTMRKKVYKILIDEMENADWDCVEECMNVDDAYDKAVKELHPEY